MTQDSGLGQRFKGLWRLVGNTPLLVIRLRFRGEERLLSFRGFMRVCHTCCDPDDCNQQEVCPQPARVLAGD